MKRKGALMSIPTTPWLCFVKPAGSQVQTSVSHAPIKKRQQVDVFHGRADRIASPSTHFRAATYVAKMLR